MAKLSEGENRFPTEDGGNETRHWQSAIDAASSSGGGVVRIPAGRHMVAQLYLRSNVELHLSEGAVLEGIVGIENYPRIDLPYSEGTWSAIVFAYGVTNVAVTGRGEIFGKGAEWPFPSRSYPGCQEGLRARGLFFGDCCGVRLQDFSLKDAASWGIVFKRSRQILARKVKVDSHAHLNNDGFDIEASNVLIEDCDVDTGDDAICIKSNDPNFVVSNVVVRGCVARSHSNALKIGTASHGTVRGIRFEQCRTEAPRREFIAGIPNEDWRSYAAPRRHPRCPFGDGHGAINVECVDGGSVSDVVFDDIEVDGFAVPIFIRGGRRLSRKCGIPPGRQYVLRDVIIRNVRGRATSRNASTVTGVTACLPKNVLLQNVDILCFDGELDSRAVSTPGCEFDAEYPEATMFSEIRLPAYGLYVGPGAEVCCDNVRFTRPVSAREDRPAIVGCR